MKELYLQIIICDKKIPINLNLFIFAKVSTFKAENLSKKIEPLSLCKILLT